MIPAFIDHLWQSSLFVLLAWVSTSLLHRNGAHLRYWIWLAASLKFLVPFSLLALIGKQIAERVLHAPVSVAFSTAKQVAAPLVAPATYIASSDENGFALTEALVLSAWAIGFLALIVRWLVRWRELQTMVRAAIPSPVIAPIPVLSSPTLHEPGVVGIRRPVLLLPEQIASQLDGSQLRAILEHELCHVRRRDNLTSAIHMFVEAVFWFHPLVWWVGARLIHERERACDEAVVRSGHHARTYAEGILTVCRHYVGSKLTCVSGVSGADLQIRLEAIMKNETIVGLGRAKSLFLGTTGLAIFAAPVFIGLTFASPGQAQTPATQAVSSAATPVGRIQSSAGNRVRLQYQDADVRQVLKALADAARVNILVSDKIDGTITVSLAEMPWDQALTIVLDSMRLIKHEKDGIVFIEPAANASKARAKNWPQKWALRFGVPSTDPSDQC